MITDTKITGINSSFHEIQYGDRRIRLDVNSSRCIMMEKTAIGKNDDADHADFLSDSDVLEYRSLKRMGYFSVPPLTGIPSDNDLLIHEVQLEINQRCNMQCAYCYADCSTPVDTKISLKEAQSLIDAALERFVGNGKSSWIVFNLGLVGEVLLDLDLYESIQKYIEKKSSDLGKALCCIYITTNGTLLSSGIARKLWNLNHKTKIIISIDGPKYIHDQTRRFSSGKGSYDTLYPLIKDCTAKWNTVAEATLTGKNPNVTDIFLHLFEFGFSSICLKPVRLHKTNELSINESNINRIKEEYSKFIGFLMAQDDPMLLDYLSCINERDMFGRFFF